MSERGFRVAAGSLLAITFLVQVSSVLQETQTWDEGVELAGGYAYLKTGAYHLEAEHPPLGKSIAALPLLLLEPTLPVEDHSWVSGDARRFADLFMWLNRVRPDTMLFAARMPSIIFTLTLGLAIAWWTRRHFGALSALLALAIYCFDPTVIAHGRYLKNDILAALLSFLALISWGHYLAGPGVRRLAVSGVLLGLAFSAKFSTLFLVPSFLLLYATAWWRSRRIPGNPWHAAVLLFIALSVLLLVYAPARPAPHLPASEQHHPLLTGLDRFASHTSKGHKSYLFGEQKSGGWWYYFPVAFSVKSPAATLALLLVAFWLAAGRWKRWREAPLEVYVLAVPLLLFLGFTMGSKINIGIRHLLPAYPLLFISGSVVLARWKWRFSLPMTLLLVAALAVESLSIYPHYTAFFNVLVGGPESGPNYLVDSNLDWGQDVKKLKAWMEGHGVGELCLAYFGTAAPSMYGIRFRDIILMKDAERETRGCVVAVSATLRQGVYVPEKMFAWLGGETPIARIGYSIYVYDRRVRIR